MQVHWPLDAKWYDGLIDGYNEETCRHHVWIFLLIFESVHLNNYIWTSMILLSACGCALLIFLIIMYTPKFV